MKWSVVYKKAIQDDGTLLFPERLSQEFLDNMRRSMGSYFFANQYQNEILPDSEKRFKSEWLRYYDRVPEGCFRFAFVDPAIGQKDHHDFTGIVIVNVSPDGQWFLSVANRYKITPTEVISKLFEIHERFNLKAIGIETVAYQESLLYFLSEEMRRRQKTIPVTGIKRSNQSKESRILSLVPRFEWGRIHIARGLTDFEDEYSTFPRGSHDDLLDALSSIEEMVYYPKHNEPTIDKPHSLSHPDYEKWYIQNLAKTGGRNG